MVKVVGGGAVGAGVGRGRGLGVNLLPTTSGSKGVASLYQPVLRRTLLF